MIPEFDGTLRHKLQEFLNACTYAARNINPADEELLMEAILYTKLKGKAMQDFENFQLETCYQTRQSTTHLQIEFNSLKQKLNETKLYDSMIEGEEHPAHSKRTIHETIKKQALINFQIGLHDELKVLVRAQRYTTLQEAITGASVKEKLLGPTKSNYLYNKNSTHLSRDKIEENNKKPNEKFAESKRPPRQFKRNSESDSNSSIEEKNISIKKTRPAVEYRITHIKEASPKNEEIQMLYDSGSTISLIKLKHLKDDTPIQEEKIALTGVTGHKIYTVGKMYGTIRINKVKHAFYVVRDDIPIEYEGILGIDFLRQHSVTCDYKYNRLKIGNAMLNLHPFYKIILKPRSETIIKARTNQNRIGIVRAEEKAPGVYIGNCMVNAADYTWPVSVINTTDREVEMQTPLIALKEIESDTTSEMYTIHTGNNLKPKISRNARI
ncbi:hypothetical protein ACFW04_014791 [Cataglyphis niger]